MKTIKEVETYIKKQAILYFTADDPESFEIIEFNTFKAILKFAVAEGLVYEELDFKQMIEDSDNNPDPNEPWDNMLELLEIFDRLEEQKKLPKSTTKLYKLWKKSFWEPNY